ncbi:hypothetical protein [Herbaspirillum seropedicae]|uniref:hypothetical protein n=2 Tax=Herbaspirillum seropedicae TaxID=964 RepID=UPI000A7A5367|nr:hypothetical protein [Herbaspirillum seropedicae]
MKIKFLSSLGLALILTACASSKPANVMPMAGGQYRTTGFGESENDAQAAALKAADAACNKQGKRFEVVNSQTKYKGVVSESTNRNLKAAGDLAAWAGSWVPTLSGDDDYEVTLLFSCAA